MVQARIAPRKIPALDSPAAAGAALRTFFNISRAWDLSATEEQRLKRIELLTELLNGFYGYPPDTRPVGYSAGLREKSGAQSVQITMEEVRLAEGDQGMRMEICSKVCVIVPGRAGSIVDCEPILVTTQPDEFDVLMRPFRDHELQIGPALGRSRLAYDHLRGDKGRLLQVPGYSNPEGIRGAARHKDNLGKDMGLSTPAVIGQTL